MACGRDGIADFELIRRWETDESVFMWAFDVIELNGEDMRRRQLEMRKATLEIMLRRSSPGILFNEHMEGDGPIVFQHACKLGLEGIVSKRKDSRYVSGRTPPGSSRRIRTRLLLGVKLKKIGVIKLWGTQDLDERTVSQPGGFFVSEC